MPVDANPDAVIGSRDQTRTCTTSERMEYVLAMLDRFTERWDDLGGRSSVRCEIRLSLSRAGEVIGTEFIECPDDTKVRGLVLSAIELAQPFPEPSNPSCFSETFDVSVGPPDASISKVPTL